MSVKLASVRRITGRMHGRLKNNVWRVCPNQNVFTGQSAANALKDTVTGMGRTSRKQAMNVMPESIDGYGQYQIPAGKVPDGYRTGER